MTRLAYVNGRFVRHADAAVHIEDRGYQFADGVYEVVTLLAGGFVDEAGHLARLKRSLAELRIAMPFSDAVLKLVMRELVRRNGVRDGYLYLQITRGVAPRDFKFPKSSRSAIVMTTRRQTFVPTLADGAGVRVVTVRVRHLDAGYPLGAARHQIDRPAGAGAGQAGGGGCRGVRGLDG